VANYTTLYVALRNSGTECTGTGYARQAITFAGASGNSKANSADVVFTPGAAVDWGSVNQWAIYTDATPGADIEISSGPLAGTRDMGVANSTLTIAAGQLTLTIND
jgi:hypothetical protein